MSVGPSSSGLQARRHQPKRSTEVGGFGFRTRWSSWFRLRAPRTPRFMGERTWMSFRGSIQSGAMGPGGPLGAVALLARATSALPVFCVFCIAQQAERSTDDKSELPRRRRM